MSAQIVTVTGTNPIATVAGSRIVAVSSNVGDTQNVFASGLIGGVGGSNTIALLGRREVASVDSFDSLDALSMSAAPAGTVTVRKWGNAATGYAVVITNPDTGDNVVLGLVGFARTYTFAKKAQSTILCLGGAATPLGSYFDISLGGAAAHRFWYQVSGGGAAPANPGGGLTMIAILAGDTADQVATKTQIILDAVANINATVSTATVTVNRDSSFGTMTIVDGAVATVFTFTTVESGTADAADLIAIGATSADSADNLKMAINADGVAGTNYGTGTTAHAQLTATVAGVTITMTDSVGVNRVLGWTFTTSSANVDVISPINGVDGAVVALLTAGDSQAFNSLSFDSEDVSVATLPALLTPTSDPIFIGGKRFTAEAIKDATGSTIAWKLQSSSDQGTTWRDLATTPSNITNTLVRFTPTEHIERARVVFVTNANTAARSVNLKIVF